MSGPFPVQAGTQPSGTPATAAQTVASSSSGPVVVATPPSQQPVPQQGQQQGQLYPKTPMQPPLAFSGEKKDEDLNTWLRTVPVWVKAKRTLQEEEVITAASYLEGKAAKWLDGIVAMAGYGRRMAEWAKTMMLDQFLEMVEARWHNPQQAQIATDAMHRLDQRKFKSVRELTTTIESLIVVLGINYDDEFLLTTFVRCLPENLRDLLASEARLEYHSFETLSRKALDLEATLGSAEPSQNDTRKKKSPQEWKKKGTKLMMVESDGTRTEIEELSDLLDGSEYDDEETAEGSTLAAVVKAKAGGRVKGHQKSQGKAASNQTKVADWVKAGLDQEVWRYRRVCGACINCGEYGHTQYKCQNAKVTQKIPPKMGASSSQASSSGNTRSNGSRLNRLFALKQWIEVIDQYDFKLKYLKGEYNKVVDALSRRADYLGALVSDFGVSDEVTQSFVGAYQEDPVTMDIMRKLKAKDKATESEFVMVDGLIRPELKGQSVSMDFMDTLVTSKRGKRHIFVIIDRFTKYARLVAMPETARTDHVIKLFMDNWVGECVWVKASELGQEFGISRRKLMPQYFGPWEVLDIVGDEMDGPTYVIRIPGHLRTHPVFHALKLAPFAETDQFPSRRSMLPPTMDGQVDIDDIVDHRDTPIPKSLGRGRPHKPNREYRVRFRHHKDPKEDRWFTKEELIETAPQVVAEYERMLKGKAPAK
ncbi:hypothetical protein CBR_g57894 [Chara braunii]|uniref:CCHC-type domain-containing protein n=1 Tax=Chara braunii TaxID=69332 RepID=A0A388MEF5_CHABU|nr:hypothetical protein CBR_g57894 [Chara braunii]|eukprot:GBG92937.1 hypothetical protein CBR_g57894 [Chara braunii]